MISLTQAAAFLLAAVLLTVSPGPDNLMVLGIGMARGRRPGMAFGLGCAIGCLFHTLLAVIGVSALLAASPVAFLLLRWAGGAWLIRLGVLALRHASAVRVNPATDARVAGLVQLFGQGLLANAINPKVVLFFLSFLPQFVQPAAGSVATQLAQLGALFTLQAALLFSVLGYFSGSIGDWLSRTPGTGRWLDRLAGVVFVALGLRILMPV